MADAGGSVALYTQVGDVRWPEEVAKMFRSGPPHVKAREESKFRTLCRLAQPAWGSSLEEFTEGPHGSFQEDEVEIGVTNIAVPAGEEVQSVVLGSFLQRFLTLALQDQPSLALEVAGYKLSPSESLEGGVRFEMSARFRLPPDAGSDVRSMSIKEVRGDLLVEEDGKKARVVPGSLGFTQFTVDGTEEEAWQVQRTAKHVEEFALGQDIVAQVTAGAAGGEGKE